MSSDRKLQISVDAKVCTGTRLCQLAAQNTFSFDADAGTAVAPTAPVLESEALWDALEGCPTEALIAKVADSGEQVFP